MTWTCSLEPAAIQLTLLNFIGYLNLWYSTDLHVHDVKGKLNIYYSDIYKVGKL